VAMLRAGGGRHDRKRTADHGARRFDQSCNGRP
jgi:hypothetical protein